MLYETAQTAVQEIVRTYDEQEIRKGFNMAQDEYLRQGVTTIHDAGVGRGRGVDILKTYQQARREGFLKFRVNMFIQWALLKELDFALQVRFRRRVGSGRRVQDSVRRLDTGHNGGIARAVLLRRQPEGLAHLRAGRAERDGDDPARAGLPDRDPRERRRRDRLDADSLRECTAGHPQGRPPLPHRALPGVPPRAHRQDAGAWRDSRLLRQPRLLLGRPAP